MAARRPYRTWSSPESGLDDLQEPHLCATASGENSCEVSGPSRRLGVVHSERLKRTSRDASYHANAVAVVLPRALAPSRLKAEVADAAAGPNIEHPPEPVPTGAGGIELTFALLFDLRVNGSQPADLGPGGAVGLTQLTQVAKRTVPSPTLAEVRALYGGVAARWRPLLRLSVGHPAEPLVADVPVE
jgi:hypothetical protein